MSKVIKQMQMDALKSDFKGVRDMVLMSVVGLPAIPENQIRLSLRKKGIRMQMVKNSLARRVLGEMGLQVSDVWQGSTTIAWGGTSVAELSKEIEGVVKKQEKTMKVKTVIADGQEVTFALALKMPTRGEALSRVAGLALAPASRLAAQILGPGSTLCGQIKGIKDMRKDEAPAAPADVAPPA